MKYPIQPGEPWRGRHMLEQSYHLTAINRHHLHGTDQKPPSLSSSIDQAKVVVDFGLSDTPLSPPLYHKKCRTAETKSQAAMLVKDRDREAIELIESAHPITPSPVTRQERHRLHTFSSEQKGKGYSNRGMTQSPWRPFVSPWFNHGCARGPPALSVCQ